jgi:hypothetical protein
MPLFHFNSCTAGTVLPDEEGEELPSLDEARQIAETSAKETLIEAIKTGDVPPDHIQITDAEGREIGIVPLQRLLGYALRLALEHRRERPGSSCWW